MLSPPDVFFLACRVKMEVKATVLHDGFAVLQPSSELGLLLPLRSNDPNKPSDLAESVSPPVMYG